MESVEHVVVMGVSGSGKTTVARLLAERSGRPFAEADDLHPAANIAKMAAAVPLTDDDRWPWLRLVRDWLTEQARAGRSTVVTCSALKAVYRDVLREAEGRVRFVQLAVPAHDLTDRLDHRVGHFMPAALLGSQLATFEALNAHEDGVVVASVGAPEQVGDAVVQALGPGWYEAR